MVIDIRQMPENPLLVSRFEIDLGDFKELVASHLLQMRVLSEGAASAANAEKAKAATNAPRL
jgi:hypothetical protein